MAVKRRDPKRTLILRLRRTVKVSTRHDVEQVGPLTEKLTCRECGHSEEQTFPKGMDPVLAARLIRYRGHAGGVRGVCLKCSKRAAEKRYPLPEDRTE
jgi:hypothetical protein